MDFDIVPNTFIWSSCSIFLGKVAGVHGLEWHECDAFEALHEIGHRSRNRTRFFAKRSKKHRIRDILAQEPRRFCQRKTQSFSPALWIIDLWTGANLFLDADYGWMDFWAAQKNIVGS